MAVIIKRKPTAKPMPLRIGVHLRASIWERKATGYTGDESGILCNAKGPDVTFLQRKVTCPACLTTIRDSCGYPLTTEQAKVIGGGTQPPDGVLAVHRDTAGQQPAKPKAPKKLVVQARPVARPAQTRGVITGSFSSTQPNYEDF